MSKNALQRGGGRIGLPPATRRFVADVAQLAERVLGKDEVTGSIPVIGSTIPELTLRHGVGRKAVGRHARHHYVGVHGVQAAKLHDDQEQEEDDRPAPTEPVLSLLPQAHAAPGVEIGDGRCGVEGQEAGALGRLGASETLGGVQWAPPFRPRPVAQLVEHRSPKPGAGGSSPSWPARPVGGCRDLVSR